MLTPKVMLLLYQTIKVKLILIFREILFLSIYECISLVYKVIYEGPCACEMLYQGHEHLVNINNRYLVHYGLRIVNCCELEHKCE